jgi:hypothetical protein
MNQRKKLGTADSLLRLSAVLVLLGLIAAGPAAASVVPINNHGFETVNTTTGCTDSSGNLSPNQFISTVYLGSGCSNADPFAGTWSVSGTVGVWYPDIVSYPSGAPEGTNVAFANDGSISQTLSSMAVLGTYTLSLYVGGRCDIPINNYTVALTAGATVIASDTSTLVSSLTGTGKCSRFLTDTLIGTVTDSSLGSDQLVLTLSETGGGNTNQAAFDDVTLNFQPASTTPEPGTLILFGSGLVSLAYRLRRKRYVQS